MAEITFQLNGNKQETTQGTDLAHLVESLSLPSQRIAIELNGAVIRRSDWPSTGLDEGDRVEVVHFVGGG